MYTLPMYAYAFAATFRLEQLAVLFQGAEILRDSQKSRIIASFPDGDSPERMALLYDFGAVVFVGFEPEEREGYVREIQQRVGRESHVPLTETFLLEVRPDAKTEVRFDRIVVPKATLPGIELAALLLAQSAVLDDYEADISDIFGKTAHITTRLEEVGRIPGGTRSLGRFIGSCIKTRNEIVASLALFDKPESTWEDPELDRLYEGLREELEIEDRFRAMEARLSMIQDNLMLFIEVTQNRSAWRLELTIVLLIVFEILLTLYTMWRGAGHL